MATIITKKTKSKKRFLQVDVWQKHFGSVSVRAIHEIYIQKFGASEKRESLSHCINSLRRLEDPTYQNPKDLSREVEYVFIPTKLSK